MLLELGQRPLRHRHDVRRRSGTAIGPHERRARSSRAFGGVAEPSQANSAPVPARTPTPRCDEVFWYSYCLVAGGDAPAMLTPEALWYHRLRRAAATSGVPSMRPKRRVATSWHYYRPLRVARWRRTRPRADLSYLDGGPCDYSANAASPRLTRATRRPGGLPRRPGRRSACYGYVETTCRTLTPLAVRRGPELGLYTVEATVGDVLHGVPSRTLKESRLVYPAQARKWFQTPKKR